MTLDIFVSTRPYMAGNFKTLLLQVEFQSESKLYKAFGYHGGILQAVIFLGRRPS